MAHSFTYLRAGRGYLCRQRFLPGVLWRLNVSDGGSLLASLRVPPGFWKRAVLARLRPLLWRDDGRKVVLPVVGDYCIPVHKGYKVFDLARGSVFKLFEDDGSEQAFRAELVQAVRAGQLDFAPAVRSADEDRFWYEEEYVRGTIGHFLPPTQRRALLVDRTDEFVACLGAVAAAANGGAISRERYTHQTARYLRGRCNTVRRESPEAAAAIEEWTDANVAPIYEGGDANLALVFSHGDFSLKNIVIDVGDRIRVIDWEHAAPRSVYHDFCNLFVTEVYYQRAAGEPWFMDSVPDAALRLETVLRESDRHCGRLFGEEGRVLRHVYYLERMRMLLERRIDGNHIKVIQRSIEAFQEFEALWDG
ncbi:MAG: phosphotransferase [Pseudomonadota bacterium]|nr:phosphotransferase [Pseudomonadota bacterium]